MDKLQLKKIIERTLKEIDLYSDDAVNLLLGTAAQESGFGEYIRQLNNGPALGIFQMEPKTHKDHVEKYLKYKSDLKIKILKACGVVEFNHAFLEFNLKYAICMSRIHYLRKPEALPSSIDGMANYWKKHYNTRLGKGTTQEFIRNFKKHVL